MKVCFFTFYLNKMNIDQSAIINNIINRLGKSKTSSKKLFKPTPKGKSIIPILKDYYCIDYHSHVYDYCNDNFQNFNQLSYVLKYLTKWDNLKKNLDLINLFTNKLIQKIKFEKISYLKTLRVFNDCLLFSICNEDRFNQYIKKKFFLIKKISDHFTESITEDNLFYMMKNSILSSIFKLVIYKKKKIIIKDITQVEFPNMTIKGLTLEYKDELLSIFHRSFKLGILSQIRLKKMIDYLIMFYIIIFNSLNKKKNKLLLSLLILNDTPVLLKYYNSIFQKT